MSRHSIGRARSQRHADPPYGDGDSPPSRRSSMRFDPSTRPQNPSYREAFDDWDDGSGYGGNRRENGYQDWDGPVPDRYRRERESRHYDDLYEGRHPDRCRKSIPKDEWREFARRDVRDTLKPSPEQQFTEWGGKENWEDDEEEEGAWEEEELMSRRNRHSTARRRSASAFEQRPDVSRPSRAPKDKYKRQNDEDGFVVHAERAGLVPTGSKRSEPDNHSVVNKRSRMEDIPYHEPVKKIKFDDLETVAEYEERLRDLTSEDTELKYILQLFQHMISHQLSPTKIMYEIGFQQAMYAKETEVLEQIVSLAVAGDRVGEWVDVVILACIECLHSNDITSLNQLFLLFTGSGAHQLIERSDVLFGPQVYGLHHDSLITLAKFAIKYGLPASPHVRHQLCVELAKEGQATFIVDLLQSESKFRPDADVCNRILDTFVENGYVDKAIEFLKPMIKARNIVHRLSFFHLAESALVLGSKCIDDIYRFGSDFVDVRPTDDVYFGKTLMHFSATENKTALLKCLRDAMSLNVQFTRLSSPAFVIVIRKFHLMDDVLLLVLKIAGHMVQNMTYPSNPFPTPLLDTLCLTAFRQGDNQTGIKLVIAMKKRLAPVSKLLLDRVHRLLDDEGERLLVSEKEELLELLDMANFRRGIEVLPRQTNGGPIQAPVPVPVSQEPIPTEDKDAVIYFARTENWSKAYEIVTKNPACRADVPNSVLLEIFVQFGDIKSATNEFSLLYKEDAIDFGVGTDLSLSSVEKMVFHAMEHGYGKALEGLLEGVHTLASLDVKVQFIRDIIANVSFKRADNLRTAIYAYALGLKNQLLGKIYDIPKGRIHLEDTTSLNEGKLCLLRNLEYLISRYLGSGSFPSSYPDHITIHCPTTYDGEDAAEALVQFMNQELEPKLPVSNRGNQTLIVTRMDMLQWIQLTTKRRKQRFNPFACLKNVENLDILNGTLLVDIPEGVSGPENIANYVDLNIHAAPVGSDPHVEVQARMRVGKLIQKTLKSYYNRGIIETLDLFDGMTNQYTKELIILESAEAIMEMEEQDLGVLIDEFVGNKLKERGVRSF